MLYQILRRILDIRRKESSVADRISPHVNIEQCKFYYFLATYENSCLNQPNSRSLYRASYSSIFYFCTTLPTGRTDCSHVLLQNCICNAPNGCLVPVRMCLSVCLSVCLPACPAIAYRVSQRPSLRNLFVPSFKPFGQPYLIVIRSYEVKRKRRERISELNTKGQCWECCVQIYGECLTYPDGSAVWRTSPE